MTLHRFRAPLVLLGLSILLLGMAAPWLTRALVQRGLDLGLEDTTVRDRSGRVLASVFTTSHDDDPAYVWGPPYDPICAAKPSITICQQRLDLRARALGPDAPAELVHFTDTRLSPVISVTAADFQAARIAHTRHLPESQVHAVIASVSYNPVHRLNGTPSLNLLKVNLLLDGRLSRGQL